MMKILAFGAAVLATGAFVSSPAYAEKPEWRSYPLGQRVTVGVSGFRPKIDTVITARGTDNFIQGQIDFERDLALKDTKSTAIIGAKWRISKRNKLRFDYFNLDRSAGTSSQVAITINPDDGGPPVTFPVMTPLQSFVDIEVYNLGYEFAILFDEKIDWSVGLGLSWQDIGVGITAPNLMESASADVEAPLPTFNTSFSYAFNDKWLLDLGLGWLDVDFDLDNSGKFEGRIISFDAGLRWQTWKNVGFILGYQVFDVDVDAQDSEINAMLEYNYKGPRFGIAAYF